MARKKKRLKLHRQHQLFSIADVANMLGVTYGDLWKHVRVKRSLPSPRHRCGSSIRKYYSDSDVKKIQRMVVVE